MARQSKALTAWDEDLAVAAQTEYEAEKAGSGGTPQISIKNSVFSMGENELGTELTVVIADERLEHVWYDSPYDADNPSTPACWAIGSDEDDMQADPASPAPQSETGACADCWANEWGSSDNGKRKACNNKRRLALLAVGDEGVVTAEVPMLRVPATSIKPYAAYKRRVNKTLARPLRAVVTTLSFDENADWEKLQFNAERKLTKEEWLAVSEVLPTAEEVVEQNYDPENYVDPEEIRKQRRAAGGTRKKAAAKKQAPPARRKKAAAKRRSKMS